MTASRPTPVEPALLEVDRLALSTHHGTVFAPVSFRLPAGRLALIVGRAGTGRSALLLALTGRMQGIRGEARLREVDVLARPRRAREMSAVARLGDLVDLQPQLTVAESITERTLIDGISTRVGWQRYDGIAEQLDLRLDERSRIGDLSALDEALLCVALATLRPADLIVLDDIDRALSVADQAVVLDRLAALCRRGHTMVVSTTEEGPAPADAVIVRLDQRRPHSDPPTSGAPLHDEPDDTMAEPDDHDEPASEPAPHDPEPGEPGCDGDNRAETDPATSADPEHEPSQEKH